MTKGNTLFSHPQRRTKNSRSYNSLMKKRNKMQKSPRKSKGFKSPKKIQQTDIVPSAPFTSNIELFRRYKTGSTRNVEIYDESDEILLQSIETRGSMLNVF
jgi:hypothetical protein